MEASVAPTTGPVAEYHDRETWLLERARSGIGSSEVSIILGLDPFGRSEADLQRKKLAAIDDGRLLDSPDNDAMLRGRLFEDDAIELWQMRAERGRAVRRVALRQDREVGVLLSSADRQALSSGELPTAPLEAKVPGWRQFKIIEDGGLSDYMNVQGQVHSLVHGAPGTEWVVMRADPLAVRGFWIPADEDFGDIIRERVAAWWIRHIIEREPAPELPADEASVDLSKLPKVEGRVVRLDGPEDVDFLTKMWEARELRDEAKAVYDELVAQVKEGRYPLGVFEGGDFRMYHSQRGGGKRFKCTKADVAQLVDPLRLEAVLTREAEKRRLTSAAALAELLHDVADEIRVNPESYEVNATEYQEVKLYQTRKTAEAF